MRANVRCRIHDITTFQQKSVSSVDVPLFRPAIGDTIVRLGMPELPVCAKASKKYLHDPGQVPSSVPEQIASRRIRKGDECPTRALTDMEGLMEGELGSRTRNIVSGRG
jgi:hypothetical protein